MDPYPPYPPTAVSYRIHIANSLPLFIMELSPPPSPAGLSGSRGATVEEEAATAESVVGVGVAGAGEEVAGAAGAGEEADPDLASQGLGRGGSDDMKSAGARWELE